MTTINYSYLDDTNTQRYGEWSGDRDEAIGAGIDALRGSRDGDEVTYYAEETSCRYAVGTDDVAQLGAALLAGVDYGAVYSIWCADTHAREVAEDTE